MEPSDSTKKAEEPAGRFWPDAPVRTQDEDRLGRWPFAVRVGDIIGRRTDPSSFVIGIYGPWGDGKTSLLNLLEERLKNYADVIVVRFNPWYFRDESVLLQGFFSTLARAVGKSLGGKATEFAQVLQGMGSVLSLASFSLAGGLVSVSPGESLKELGEKLGKIDLDDGRIRIEKILRESGKRVVVFVDDIDRLDAREIQAVLKLVRLSAGFDYVTYVLTFDDALVARALDETYRAADGSGGQAFLEKIIQIPLRLPPADLIALRRLTFDGIEGALKEAGIDLTEEDVQLFVNRYVLGLEGRVRTPRHARRYANALTFALPVLKGEVNVVDQLLFEGVRVLCPLLYESIRMNPDLFLGRASHERRSDAERSQLAKIIDQALEGLGEEKSSVKRLIEWLFPRTGTSGYGPDWEEPWSKQRRICSQEYFGRYFAYALTGRDVSDTQLRDFLDAAVGMDADEVATRWRELAAGDRAPRAIAKLRLMNEHVGSTALPKVCVAVARCSMVLPSEKGMWQLLSTFGQAAALVASLAEKATKESEREELLRTIMKESESLAFAAEVFRWVRVSKEERDKGKALLSEEAERRIGKELADRITNHAATNWIPQDFPDATGMLLWIWQEYGGNSDAVRSYLTTKFVAEPEVIPRFLARFTGTGWELESGLPRPGEFREDAYNSVSELVDPETVIKGLRRLYGSRMDKPDYYQGSSVPRDEALAMQFGFIHLKRTQTPEAPAMEA